MSKVTELRHQILALTDDCRKDISIELDFLIRAVRDEEYHLQYLKEKCRWDGLPSGENGETPCSRCPCEGTRYCP